MIRTSLRPIVRAARTKSALPQHDHFRADKARIGHPVDQCQRDVIARQAGLQDGDDGNDQAQNTGTTR